MHHAHRNSLLFSGFFNQGFWKPVILSNPFIVSSISSENGIPSPQYTFKKIISMVTLILSQLSKVKYPWKLRWLTHCIRKLGKAGLIPLARNLNKTKRNKTKKVSLLQQNLIQDWFSVGELPKEEISTSKWNRLRNAFFKVIKLFLYPTDLKICFNTPSSP